MQLSVGRAGKVNTVYNIGTNKRTAFPMLSREVRPLIEDPNPLELYLVQAVTEAIQVAGEGKLTRFLGDVEELETMYKMFVETGVSDVGDMGVQSEGAVPPADTGRQAGLEREASAGSVKGCEGAAEQTTGDTSVRRGETGDTHRPHDSAEVRPDSLLHKPGATD